jgi:uncharacterized protein YndB with AHSA1/START domain
MATKTKARPKAKTAAPKTPKARPADDKELVLSVVLDAPRAALFRCWTEPKLAKQWFAPKPWRVVAVDLDPRPGGKFHLVMRGPDGEGSEESPVPGVFLDVVKNERVVFTDAFTPGWVPAGRPFMVAEVTFKDEGGKTRYIARARHWNAEARAEHETMGFHEGWGQCARQLEALAKTL